MKTKIIIIRSFAIALVEILLMWGFYALAKLEYTLLYFLILFVGFVIIHLIIFSLVDRYRSKKKSQ